jgi:hypothetical protein
LLSFSVPRALPWRSTASPFIADTAAHKVSASATHASHEGEEQEREEEEERHGAAAIAVGMHAWSLT